MMLDVKKESDAFREAFAHIERAGDVLLPRRRDAFARFAEHGYPTTRDEAWKYTPLNALSREQFQRPAASTAAVDRALLRRLCYGDFSCIELVFVDGRLAANLSTLDGIPQGVTIGSVAAHLHAVQQTVTERADDSAFDFLNTALLEDGAYVHVPRDTSVVVPIHLLFVTTQDGVATHPRNVIRVDAGARATVVETWVSTATEGRYFTNVVNDITVAENARLDHYKLQREALSAYHVADTRVRSQANATFQSFFVSTGGLLVRNEIHAPLEAEGTTCRMYGLYLLDGNQHCDCHTVIDHAKPRCTSEQVYKGMLDGRSRGVFSGTVLVRADAQKTDAHQSNKNLLLSDEALINTRPQLQILADDVKCTHGVAIGSLDETQLFYLRSRGISPDEARDILTYAFASELVSKIDIDAVRVDVERRISAGLAADSEEHRRVE